ncbi:unnamed protein product [Spirodela intermedia]|uniref:STAS domain-containing protein n=1 Tax=Spirodela intermedia TaxID=51605 RepID=A0A7I8J887_SPIIN|nr:unnamed protein product [Spirodela intermedia]CAA6666271.1 unnamed protein product [Spirodela intermedia]
MGGSSNRIDDFSGVIDLESVVPRRVSPPPARGFFQALRQSLREVFFPDDPLYQFRGQTSFRKLVLALQYLFPIFQWGSQYSFSLLKSDVISGLTIASLAIPQGISYAKLANLPPIIGLYSSFVPPLVYAALGSSRDLAVGPVSIASLVMGSMLREAVSPEEPALHLQLAFTATLFAGVFQAFLGLMRLGFVLDFLSKPALIGFMGGSAIVVSLQQLKGLLGISHFTTKMGLLPVMESVLEHKPEWHWPTIAMSFSFLGFLFAARHIGLRWPKLFWVSAAAPLASVVLSTLLVYLFEAQKRGVQTIGHLQGGMNPSSVSKLLLHGQYLALAVKTGLVTGFLSLTEGIAVGRTFASLKNYQIDGNKEMMAIGLMNMAGSCTSCYVGRELQRRLENGGVEYSDGGAVLGTMLFLLPLFRCTPNAVLSAIIVAAVVGLVDARAAARLWRVDKLDFLACLSAFLGVLFFSVQTGLAVAVGISVSRILMHVTRPNTAELGSIPGTQSFQNLVHCGETRRVPSCLILGIESPILFANSTYLQERIMRWVREEEERVSTTKDYSTKCVILDLGAVTAIDSSGIEALTELKEALEKRSLLLLLANPLGAVTEKLYRSDAVELLWKNSLFLTLADAIAVAVSGHWPPTRG